MKDRGQRVLEQLGELDVDLRRVSRRRAHAKGLRLERLVQLALEAEGAKVERAPKVVVWRPDEDGGKPKPVTIRHDFWHCADMIALFPDGRRSLIQVTTLSNVAAKRVKFLRAGIRTTQDDAILAQETGRRFRELRGPDFAMPGRTLTLPAPPRSPKRPKAARPAQPVKEEQLWIATDGALLWIGTDGALHRKVEPRKVEPW